MQTITVFQLHGILTTFEMRKGGPSEVRDVTFKVTAKGKEKEEHKEPRYVSEEDEVNFVNKLQHSTGRLRGKLPFKCFASVRVVHYAAKFLYKYNNDKGKDIVKGNRKQYDNRKSYYTHEYSDGLSNTKEGESDQRLKLLMTFEISTSESNVKFVDALEKKYFFEEIT